MHCASQYASKQGLSLELEQPINCQAILAQVSKTSVSNELMMSSNL